MLGHAHRFAAGGVGRFGFEQLAACLQMPGHSLNVKCGRLSWFRALAAGDPQEVDGGVPWRRAGRRTRQALPRWPGRTARRLQEEGRRAGWTRRQSFPPSVKRRAGTPGGRGLQRQGTAYRLLPAASRAMILPLFIPAGPQLITCRPVLGVADVIAASP